MAKRRVVESVPYLLAPPHPLIASLGGGRRWMGGITMVSGDPGAGKSRLAIALCREHQRYGHVFAQAIAEMAENLAEDDRSIGGYVKHPTVIYAFSEQAGTAYLRDGDSIRLCSVQRWADVIAVAVHAPPGSVIVCDSTTVLLPEVVDGTLEEIRARSSIVESVRVRGVPVYKVTWDEKAPLQRPNSPMAVRAIAEQKSAALLNALLLSRGLALYIMVQMSTRIGGVTYRAPAVGSGLAHLCNPVIQLGKTDKPDLAAVMVKKATGALFSGVINVNTPLASLGEWLGVDTQTEGWEWETCRRALRVSWDGGRLEGS